MSLELHLQQNLKTTAQSLQSLSCATDQASLEKKKVMEVAMNIFKNMLQQLNELKQSICKKF